MKNRSLVEWILIGIVCVLCVAVIGTAVHLVTVMTGLNAGSGSADMDGYDVVFSGSIELLEENYDVVLKGKDGSFTVDAGNLLDVVQGSYTFTDGQGWTFVFSDALNTNVRSQYDAASGEHGFIYALDLGSRGAGSLRLAREDKKFDAADQPWNDIPVFSGTASWFGGAINAAIVCSCDAEGNFSIFGTGGEINVIRGTYVQNGDDYTFTTEDGTVYTAAADEQSGLPTITVPVHRPELEVYNAADTEAVLTLNVPTVD